MAPSIYHSDLPVQFPKSMFVTDRGILLLSEICISWWNAWTNRLPCGLELGFSELCIYERGDGCVPVPRLRRHLNEQCDGNRLELGLVIGKEEYWIGDKLVQKFTKSFDLRLDESARTLSTLEECQFLEKQRTFRRGNRDSAWWESRWHVFQKFMLFSCYTTSIVWRLGSDCWKLCFCT